MHPGGAGGGAALGDREPSQPAGGAAYAPGLLPGGLGLAGGLAIGAAAAGWLRPGFAAVPAGVPAVALAAGVVLFTALGLVDDLRTFSPGRKLLLQCAAAAATAAAGLAVPVTGVPAADVALGALWMVVLVNAVNLTDVCDGLVSSVAVAVFGVLALTEPGVRDGAAVVAGAALGVLAFNRPPASIFLGDAGAHLVGFLLAAATLAAGTGRPAWPGVPWAVLTCGVFLFELAFLITQRTRKGLRWWRGSPDHFALRLQAAGVGRGTVDAGAGLAAAALAVCGAWLWRLERGGAATLLAVAGLALAVAWRALARLDAPRAGRLRRPRPHPWGRRRAPSAIRCGGTESAPACGWSSAEIALRQRDFSR